MASSLVWYQRPDQIEQRLVLWTVRTFPQKFATVSDVQRITSGARPLEVDGPQYGRADVLCQWLSRLYLQAYTDVPGAREWLLTNHPRLQTTPLQAMESVEGLIALTAVHFGEDLDSPNEHL